MNRSFQHYVTNTSLYNLDIIPSVFIDSIQHILGNITTSDYQGFKILPSHANFIFASHPQQDAGELAAALRERCIIVRYFNKPRINQYLRITIGTDDQNQRLVDTLKYDILA